MIFPPRTLIFLNRGRIDLSALQKIDGPTFRWGGYYEYDMNQAHTLETKLNVLSQFNPQVPLALRSAPYVFLANIDPDLQLKVIAQLERPKLLIADTMNFWIESKRDALHEVIKKVDYMVMNDGEIRQFMETPNIPLAARRLIELGCKGVIVKKGEHGALLFTKSSPFFRAVVPAGAAARPDRGGRQLWRRVYRLSGPHRRHQRGERPQSGDHRLGDGIVQYRGFQPRTAETAEA